MGLKRFLERAKNDYGTFSGWIEELVKDAYVDGVKEGKCREKRRNRAYAIDAIPNHGICEVLGCIRKAKWNVCQSNGAGTRRCGRHNKGDGLTLKMYKMG